jgi:hypothetical protein
MVGYNMESARVMALTWTRSRTRKILPGLLHGRMANLWQMQKGRQHMLPVSLSGSARRHPECMEIPFPHQLQEIESSR